MTQDYRIEQVRSPNRRDWFACARSGKRKWLAGIEEQRADNGELVAVEITADAPITFERVTSG